MPEFFNKRNYLILLGLIFISMIILTVHSREGENGVVHRAQRLVLAATSPLQAAVTTVLQPVKDGWDYLVHFGDIKRENRELRGELIELRGKLTSLQNLKSENDRLRKLVGFMEKEDYKGVPARVIGFPTSNWSSSIVVSRGSRDGVKRNMPVVVGGGLVGQVVDVWYRAAKVVLLNDVVQSGVSVQVKRTGEVGVIKGQLKSKLLSLEYISRDSTVREGDTIITSGLGGVFPRGIYVGRVKKVQQSPYSLHKTIEIATPVDLANLEEVFIIKYQPAFVFSKERN
ncbi:MAG TPA: rod shape-determining protein MreC [Anaerolineae bacterium]|jgi:rod shape-determining protein MreC|nr:rod shape-determining protein MreC [Anaerolineae bacterium]